MFITPKRLCFYHVKLAQKTRVSISLLSFFRIVYIVFFIKAVYPFEEVVIVPLSPSDPKAFSVNVKEKAVIVSFREFFAERDQLNLFTFHFSSDLRPKSRRNTVKNY